MIMSTGGSSAPFSFVMSPTWSMEGNLFLVTSMGKASISLAHTGSMPLRTAASGNPPIPSNRLPSVGIMPYPCSALELRFAPSQRAELLLDFQLPNLSDGDAEPLGLLNLTGHAGTDPAAAEPQFIADFQHPVSQPQSNFPFCWLSVIQHLWVEQVDGDGRMPLMDGIPARLFRKRGVCLNISCIGRGDVNQFFSAHFAAPTACTTVRVVLTADCAA